MQLTGKEFRLQFGRFKSDFCSLRTIFSETGKLNFRPLKSFELAQKVENSYLIVEGDYGGQIFFIAPVAVIKCSKKVLGELIIKLNEISWHTKAGAGVSVYLEVLRVGSRIPGGMGGGRVLKGIWIHSEFNRLKNKIIAVINGKISSL